MPSPFPGMNPYLEQPGVWKDFHDTFIPTLRETLLPLVAPTGYYVRIDESLYIRETWDNKEAPVGRGDLNVWPTKEPLPAPTGAVTIVAPILRELPPVIDTERIPFLEVVNRESRRVVTVIELLRPTNKKPGDDRKAYLAKRRQLLSGDVNLVEIDLLRGGHRPPVQDPPRCDYCVLVSWPSARPEVGLWPVLLREPLPKIPIPLRAGEPDAMIDLQTLLHRVYDAGGYHLVIYAQEPEPQLSPEDAAWAAGLIPARS